MIPTYDFRRFRFAQNSEIQSRQTEGNAQENIKKMPAKKTQLTLVDRANEVAFTSIFLIFGCPLSSTRARAAAAQASWERVNQVSMHKTVQMIASL